MNLRDRFYTRRTAEAIMAPSSIIVGGAATALGIAAGAPIVAAAALGAVAYAGWVARRMPRAAAAAAAVTDPIDLRRLREPWRRHVGEALDAQQRFTRAVAATGAGPIRERLALIGERIDDGVRECWRIANRGQELETALRELVAPAELAQRIAALRAGPPSATAQDLVASLEGQAESHRRIAGTATDARNRLELLEVRLDEAVARAVELSLQTGDARDLGGLHDDVQEVVGEMEALRRGLEEMTGQTAPG
jgi:type II secretory pathway component HofQ